MKDTKYVPINCSYYDELEALATLKRKSVIQYHDLDGNETKIEGIIKDFRADNGVEYMIMEDGKEIRLDKLYAVNGKPLQ